MTRRIVVEPVFVTLLVSLLLLVGVHDASAKGCIKGAAVGAVAGHVAGHHAVIGAVAGCAVGHHLAKKRERQERQERQQEQQPPLRQPQSTTPMPQPIAPDAAATAT